MLTEEIRNELFRQQDLIYRELQVRTIPTLSPETVIGVRTPALRAYAKQLTKQADTEAFLQTLPHDFFDENQLHAFILSEMKDFEKCVREVDRFLPYVDNWATCDQLSPKVFGKHQAELLRWIRQWMASDATYTIRFGIGMLMQHFLKEAFDPVFPEMVASIRSEEYYVNMMIAWYFATALAAQYEAILPYIEHQRLDAWTHNKAIQKAIESYRITPEQKAYLKTLKVSTKRGAGKAQKAGQAQNGQNKDGDQVQPRKTVHVVAAILCDGLRVFATQRGYGDRKDYWEFPGGKMEAGETPEQALKREIREELDTEISVGEKLITVEYDYPDFHLHMECFLAKVASGSLVLKEHEAARWLRKNELDEVQWLPADQMIIEKIQEQGLLKGGTSW